jgi:ComF family protein
MPKSKSLMPVLNRALDFLFPPQCPTCDTLVPAHGTLCLPCWQGVKFISAPMCHACGLPFEFEIAKDALCGECLKDLPPYARARSVFVYSDASRALVTKLKFSDQLYLATVYGPWLAKAGAGIVPHTDLIVPVPLSWRRFVGRKYNQAALLAHALSKQTGKPVIPDMLHKVKHTPPQTGLSRKQREDNLKGAFAINPRHKAALKGKTVLLIDDVHTTGATLAACAKLLLKNGAMQVNALTLARTNN